MLKGYKR